jgi:hypothetical protein
MERDCRRSGEVKGSQRLGPGRLMPGGARETCVRRRKGGDEVRATKSVPGSQSDATGMLSCRSRSWVLSRLAGLGGRSDT